MEIELLYAEVNQNFERAYLRNYKYIFSEVSIAVLNHQDFFKIHFFIFRPNRTIINNHFK